MTGERAWPPIQIGEDEWIIMRTERSRPAAVVKRFAGAASTDRPGRSYFRCVTWAERSADRRLIGRFRTLDEADAAVVAPSAEEFRPGATARSERRPGAPTEPRRAQNSARNNAQHGTQNGAQNSAQNSSQGSTDAWEQGAVPWDATPRRTNRYA